MFRMGTLISVYAELSKKNVTPVYVADLNLHIRGAVWHAVADVLAWVP